MARRQTHKDQQRPKSNRFNAEIKAMNNAAAKLAKSREDRFKAEMEAIDNENPKPE